MVECASRAVGRTALLAQQAAVTTADDPTSTLRAGVDPGSAEADALAERHRASIGTYFTCSHARHVCLARSYTDDPDHAAHYDAQEPGLARWLRLVIEANAAAHGVDPATATWD